jgi:hypothetical protein
MRQANGFSTSNVIDFLRESTEAALDLSKDLTAAHSPGDLLNVWTRFAEEQYCAIEKFTYRLTGQSVTAMRYGGTGRHGMGRGATESPQANGSSHPAAPAVAPDTSEADDAALLSDLQEQADSLRSQVDALNSQVAALADRLVALEGRPLKVKFSFGEPPHTGWTPAKVVVLGNDANGNLIELPSTIEDGGFRYTGAPSFWIAIG